MKSRMLLVLAFCGLISPLFGMEKVECTCQTALDEAHGLLQKAKSYKVLVKGEREAALQEWKEKIKQEMASDPMVEDFCLGYLQKFTSFVKDKHNQLYYASQKDYPSSYPSYQGKWALDTTSFRDEYEGVYYAGTEKLLLKNSAPGQWLGIMLASDDDKWTHGTIRLKINMKADGTLEIFEFFKTGLLYYQPSISIRDGRIHGTYWNKSNKYHFLNRHEEKFHFEQVSNDTDYIGLKTFTRTRKLMDEAADFYAKALPRLTHMNLIVDLRSNGGGSVLQAKPLLQHLRQNKQIEHIYVLVNFKTASAAELVAIKLLEDQRVKLAGENTSGMLAFGYGNHAFTDMIDCRNIKVSFSTKKSKSGQSTYEFVGLTPTRLLGNVSDWVDQLTSLR